MLPQFKTLAGDDRAPVREAASHAIGRLVMLGRASGAGDGGEVGKKGWSMLAKLVADSSPEVGITFWIFPYSPVHHLRSIIQPKP